MPDLKTVTFDASQWQIVPKVPTDAMLDAAACASMQHLIDCIRDPEKSNEIGSEENVRKTHASRYHSMLAAAPTPAAQSADHSGESTEKVAAQSAGQEAVAWLVEWKVGAETWVQAHASEVPAVDQAAKNGGSVTPLGRIAAPVNGGERELGQVIDERDRAEAMAEKLADAIAKHFGVEIGEHSNLNCPWQNALDHIAHMSAQDDKRNCQKCGGDCSAANPPVIHCPMEKHAADAPQSVAATVELREVLDALCEAAECLGSTVGKLRAKSEFDDDIHIHEEWAMDEILSKTKLARAALTSPAKTGDLPTLEALELFAANLAKDGRLTWAGFRKDSDDRHTIPIISPATYKLVCAAIAEWASPAKEQK